ncbi:MAG: hypothetical protein FJW86_14000 [Actinobacteria bacterium]|nr:hypothetical protein [Actinomycetota bacterium]
MDCTRIQESISARLDGEATDLDLVAIDTHLATCVSCQGYEHRARRLHASLRINPAPAVPDLTAAVMHATSTAPRVRTSIDPLRIVLAGVALVQIALASPALLFGDDAGVPIHTARHLGSFTVALGVGFLIAAWRPERISGLLPIAAALVCCLLVTSAVDVANGRASLAAELGHGPEVLGLVVAWLLARVSPRPRPVLLA